MSVPEIDIRGLVIPRGPIAFDHQEADASKAPDSCGAQISQIWIFSFLTGTELAPVQNGRSARLSSGLCVATAR